MKTTFLDFEQPIAELETRIEELLDFLDIRSHAHLPVKALSGGFQRRLSIALSLMNGPELLILDEPTTGVDPVSRVELWRLLAGAAAGGAAVALATTYLDEAERAATVLVLDQGRALLAGTPEEVLAAVPGKVVEAQARPQGVPAWRRGARWRAWSPDGSPLPGATEVAMDLEDAVVVAQLAREQRSAA